jgi:ferredoxin-NADP reductase
LFGENLTLDGLADSDVRIGDRLAVGSTVLEVTQPRVTCYKVGIRLGEPRMPALLTGHGRPGFYLRVLQEGDVGEGDAVAVVARGPGALTVERVSAMLYRPDYDAVSLRLAVGTPALADGWRRSFRQQLDQLDRTGGEAAGLGNSGLTGTVATPPAYRGFRPFRVVATRWETPSAPRPVRSLVLETPDGSPPPPHRAGQFVAVRVPDRDGTAQVRSYSLSAPADGRRLRISVKRDGRVSGLLHDTVGEGDVVELAAPRGTFVLADAAGATAAGAPPVEPPLLLVSAGIGVTPLLAILGSLARSAGGPSVRPVTWVHVARSGAEHAFREEARALLAELPAARAHVRHTRPGPGDPPAAEIDGIGRLDATALSALAIAPDSEALVCGPDGFMAEVTALLVAAGLDPAAIRTETFGGGAARPATAPHPPADAPGDGAAVTYSRSGLTVRFGRGRWASLLEQAESADVPADWSCRTGVCHRCESGLVAGDVGYDPEPLDPPAPGNVLLCVATPRGDVTLDL